MSDMPIRLLALDLDGTLLDEEKRVPPALVDLLSAFVAGGGTVTTASGRFHTTQERFMAENGLGPATGWPQFLVSVDKLIHTLRDGAYEPLSAWNDPILARWRGLAREIDALMPALYAELTRRGLAYEEFATPDEMLRAAWMTLAFEDNATAMRGGEVLMEVLGHIEGLRPERNTRFAGVTMTGTGKGFALRRLAELLGIAPSAVLAMGDSCNDLTMLDGRFGFGSAAVGNAEPMVKDAVRRAGGYVAAAPGPEGVREALARRLG